MTIIGIAGGTGSGKTTVVRKIEEALPPHYVTVVPLDSYYNDTTGMTEENGEPVEQPKYSYIISNRLPETIHVEPKPVIIIEGIMALANKKLRDMMDLRIFVDTDSDVRLIRNIRRDVVERGRTVDMVLDRYEAVLKPMHEQFIEPTKKFAHVILPWGIKNQMGIHILKTFIEGIVTGVQK